MLKIEKEKVALADTKRKNNQIAYEKRKENLIKKYGISDAQKILEHMVWIGMTKEQLIESWGNPNKINTSNYGNGNEINIL